MYMKALAAATVLASLVGCGTTPENPVDYVTFRNEPLVKTVDNGMTKDQVLTIGGAPSSTVPRKVKVGTCNNYVLSHEGHQQVYHVSFDSSDHVDGKGFDTCDQMEGNERAL